MSVKPPEPKPVTPMSIEEALQFVKRHSHGILHIEMSRLHALLSGLPLVSVSPSEEAVNAALGSFNIEFWKDSPAIAAFMRENHEKAIRAAYAAQFGSSAPPKEGV